jgi:hypothetical protein
VIYLANQNNGQHAGLLLGLPSPVSIVGNTAEWIMNSPGGGFPASSLAAFTPVTFSFGFACAGTPEDPGPNADILGPGSPGAQTYDIRQTACCSHQSRRRLRSRRCRSTTSANSQPTRLRILQPGSARPVQVERGSGGV